LNLIWHKCFNSYIVSIHADNNYIFRILLFILYSGRQNISTVNTTLLFYISVICVVGLLWVMKREREMI
jgi:heme/copper-type cytochrome/quinol oxidase subunit 4